MFGKNYDVQLVIRIVNDKDYYFMKGLLNGFYDDKDFVWNLINEESLNNKTLLSHDRFAEIKCSYKSYLTFMKSLTNSGYNIESVSPENYIIHDLYKEMESE